MASLKRLLIFAILLLSLPPAVMAAQLTGSFVGGGQDFIAILQILPAGDGRVLGRLRIVSFDKKGAKQQLDRSLSGAASSDSFVGKIEGTDFLNGAVAISGTLSQGILKVSAANGLKVNMTPGDEQAFTAGVERLGLAGARIQQEDARQRAVSAANAWAARLAKLRLEVSAFLAEVPRTLEAKASEAQQWNDLTRQMSTNLSEMESLTARGFDATSKRYQYQTEISRIANASFAIAKSVGVEMSQFEVRSKALTTGLEEAKFRCQATDGPRSPSMRQQCDLLVDEEKGFNTAAWAVSRRYNLLREDWRKTKSEQQSLQERASQFMSRYQTRPN